MAKLRLIASLILVTCTGALLAAPARQVNRAPMVILVPAEPAPVAPDPEGARKAFEEKRYADALRLLPPTCEAGDAASCHSFGKMRENGLGVPRDAAMAVQFYRKACTLKLGAACLDAGNLSWKSATTDEARQQSTQDIITGCELGDAASCSDQGFRLELGRGLAKDLPAARALYLRACDMGNGVGCSNAGLAASFGRGGPASKVDALALFERGCTMNDLTGCYWAAYQISKGEGIAKPDPFRARPRFDTYCQRGHLLSCTELAYMTRHGKGGKKDIPAARRLYLQTCNRGQLGACNALGDIYKWGVGGLYDMREANRLYEKSCDGGNASGCLSLAQSYDSGQGVTLDPGMGALYRQKACEVGGYCPGR